MSKSFILIWILVIYIGSLVAQFSGLSLPMEIVTWSLLLALGVTLSPPLVRNGRQSGLLLFYSGLILLFLLTLLLLCGPSFLRLTNPRQYFLLWHLLLSAGYFYGAWFLHRSRLRWFGLLSLLSLILFFVPLLTQYHPLIFGLIQTALLLFIII